MAFPTLDLIDLLIYNNCHFYREWFLHIRLDFFTPTGYTMYYFAGVKWIEICKKNGIGR
jgi:hypothetical protein